MKSFDYWEQRNSTIFNSVGHWKGGEDVIIEGYSLMNDLMHRCSYMQVHILNATGKLIERNIADWIEICFMGLSYPDSRIWCNQISAFASDAHTSVSAAAAISVLAADSRGYGGSQARKLSMSFLSEAYKKHADGTPLKDIVKLARFNNNKPIIVGFARPIDRDDERLKPFGIMQNKLNIPIGRHLAFAKELSTYLSEHYNLSINCGGYASAFLLDQNFTPEDGYNLNAFSVVSGAIGCYRAQSGKPSNSFLPSKCNDIGYVGVSIREIRE